MAVYDEKTCICDEAAWLITRKTENGSQHAFFECHATDDQESPCGVGWYFASYVKSDSGKWDEYDGGIYWDYENATDLESVIGETLPFSDFKQKRIAYEDFEAVCLRQDTRIELRLTSSPSSKRPQRSSDHVR